MAADRRVVQQGQQARRAGTAACADDRLDLAVGEHRVQVARALGVAAGQMPAPGAQMRPHLHLQAQGLHRFLRQLQVQRLVGGGGRADQADGIAGIQC